MALIRRLLRIFFYTSLVVLAFAAGAVGVFTLTERGRANLAGIISDLASSPEQQIRLSGLSGIWSGSLGIESVTVADAGGPWLALRGVEVDWSPLALLSFRFDAERIQARRVELARLPASDTPRTGEGGGGGLPVSLDIRTIDLPDIALGPALAGGVAQLAAKASVVAEAAPLRVETEFNVVRTDAGIGEIVGSVAFAPGDDRLDVDIRASEPSGGIIATVLRLEGKPAVDLIVSGSGPAARWAGTGTFAVDGTVITRVEATHRLTETGSVVAAKGDGDFGRFVPEDFRHLLAGATAFDIAGTFMKNGGVEVERAEIASSAVRATAVGSIDPEGATDFALQLSAEGEGVPLAFGTDESPIDIAVRSASIRAIGDGREPNLDIEARLASVETRDVQANDLALALHSDAFNVLQRSGPVSGQLTAAGVVLDNATLTPLIAGQIRAGLAGTLSTDALVISDGNFGSDALDGKFSGDVSLADGSITLRLNADMASAALPAPVRPPLGERVAVEGTIRRDSEGGIFLEDMDLASGGLSATGTANLTRDAVAADIKGAVADMSVIADQAKGAIAFALTASGERARPDLSLSVTSDELAVAARQITGLSFTATGKADIDKPEANVTLAGQVAGEKLEGSAVLRTTEGRREIEGLTLSLGDSRIVGDLTLYESFVPVGRIELAVPDVGPLAALALEEAEGQLDGTIVFSLRSGVPEVALDARSGSLRRGEISAREVAVNAVVSSYLDAPAVAGKVRAAEVVSGGTAVSSIDVDLTRDGAWTGFSGGATVLDIPARAVGRVRIAEGGTVVELASGEATVRGIAARLARATTIEIAGGTTTLDRLALDLGGGVATISGTVGTALNLAATLSDVPASVANSLVPGLGAAGSISGTAKVSGAAADPVVGYTIDWTGAQTAQTRDAGFGAMRIASSGEFASAKLSFDASVGDGSGLGLKGGGTVDTAGRALSLDFAGSVPFSFLTQRLAAQGLSLTGTSQVTLTVRGAMSAPSVGGSVRASGARLVDARSGLAVNDIALQIGIGGGVARIERLTGSLSTGGSLSAGGTVGIDAGSGFPADLTVTLADGRYTDGEVVTANLSGDLAIKGALASAPLITGTVNLARTVITIPEQLPGSLGSLDVQHRNASQAVRRQEAAIRPAESGGGSSGLSLDLTINAPNQIFIQGRGLDAELGGSLRLTGPVAAPRAIGQFELRRGRLSILGKRLDFTSGILSFSGSMVPYIELSAQSTASDATVTVTVTGPADNPRFAFASVPALPEDEILARLIFGRSMSELSPLQIAQLAEAAAQFAGVGGSTTLLEKLRNQLGVDDLDIKTNEAGDTAVSAGKYLNDRTYLSVEKGEKPGSGKATIDLDIGRGVKLRGEASDGGEAKGGIFFEREY